MSRRDLVLAVIIGVCVLLTAYLLIGKPFSPKFTSPPGTPRGLHVVCTNLQCGFESQNFAASAHDPNWPKECPKCGQKTLYIAFKCPFCGKITRGPVPSSMESSITCIHCAKVINLAPPSPDAPPPEVMRR